MAEDDGRALRVTLDLIQGAEKGGFLYATIGSREVAPVMVSAKEVRLLLAMDEAMRRDRTKPEEARGWRDAEQIGRRRGTPGAVRLATRCGNGPTIHLQSAEALGCRRAARRPGSARAHPDEAGVRLSPCRRVDCDRPEPARGQSARARPATLTAVP